MALNIENLTFLFEQLRRLEIQRYSSGVSQLFDYLSTEVKDNPIFDQYESNCKNWTEWIENDHADVGWVLPNTFEKTKYLTYAIFKSISINDKDWLINFTFQLFRKSNFSESISYFNETFLKYFEKVLDDIIKANPEIEEKKVLKTKNNTIFIIHGHDNEIKYEIQLLLSRAGVNHKVLHEQADRGRTIIDKLLDETKEAGYAIALITPDDILKNETNRARQNVILEIGYFIGLLGKERIRIVVKGDVEIPSDLQGVLYEKYDNAGAWRLKLLKEIQAVGIYVDMSEVISKF